VQSASLFTAQSSMGSIDISPTVWLNVAGLG
jgi:hypothetical protein